MREWGGTLPLAILEMSKIGGVPLALCEKPNQGSGFCQIILALEEGRS